MSDEMRINLPGLYAEKHGKRTRYVVRKEGDKNRRIILKITPENPQFMEHYYAARAGIKLDIQPDTPTSLKGSMGRLVEEYIAAMDALGLHPSTIHQRSTFLNWMRTECGEYSAEMPAGELIKLRDKKSDTPGAADNFIKAVRAMYAWGIERGKAKGNPAAGIPKINRGKGAKPWTTDDLAKYRERHPIGTMAHLALTLYVFTACRISEIYTLGRKNEATYDGQKWLEWAPVKRGAKPVSIPILPPLYEAMRAQSVIGPTYLLNGYGKPFASAKAFGNKFQQWTQEAGLSGLSSHGIRKAAGELLALKGATQYEIMSIHGHASAKTSEIYTRDVDRRKLAQLAMQKLAGMDW